MAIHGKEYRKVVNALAMGEEYKGGSALRIRQGNPRMWGWGNYPSQGTGGHAYLPDGTPVDVTTIKVTVYSYATPIAWIYHDGTVEVPDYSYSVTTSGHQGLCRAWLGRGERVY